ncbi:hypothetical protein [Hymenobacter cellulosilyticus]|uniref:Uncharacterized protein n=1 Tax=Hymenobacter cellulosilyticus TaxID=2932248 RepID=A0A8T9Q0P2_9BACT|nr:hypothetical protein [Hymenobacter cellulosilyticus]UOQ70442.1 hypothetical protein MUN79_17085 [Hymenobacter cellulosilyticus]
MKQCRNLLSQQGRRPGTALVTGIVLGKAELSKSSLHPFYSTHYAKRYSYPFRNGPAGGRQPALGLLRQKRGAGPTPDPTPTYELSHYFYYPATNGGAAIIHPKQDITGEARLFPTVLALDFVAKPDMPHFEIERAQLKPDWKGQYSLKSRAQPANPVFVSYSYHTDGYRIFRFSNFTQVLTGHVTITAYDAKRQLISGNYEVTAPRKPTRWWFPSATSATSQSTVLSRI